MRKSKATKPVTPEEWLSVRKAKRDAEAKRLAAIVEPAAQAIVRWFYDAVKDGGDPWGANARIDVDHPPSKTDTASLMTEAVAMRVRELLSAWRVTAECADPATDRWRVVIPRPNEAASE